MKWTWFAGAVILSWYFLLAAGAPLAAVAAGTFAAGAFRFWRTR